MTTKMFPRRVLAARPLTRALTPTSINRSFSLTSRLRAIDPEIADPGQVQSPFPSHTHTNPLYRTAATSTLLLRNVPSAIPMVTGGTSKNDEITASLSTRTTIPSVSSLQRYIHGLHRVTALNYRVLSLLLSSVCWELCMLQFLENRVFPGLFQVDWSRNWVDRGLWVRSQMAQNLLPRTEGFEHGLWLRLINKGANMCI
jgi:hypothetical protein